MLTKNKITLINRNKNIVRTELRLCSTREIQDYDNRSETRNGNKEKRNRLKARYWNINKTCQGNRTSSMYRKYTGIMGASRRSAKETE
jgi:hypothetical protein